MSATGLEVGFLLHFILRFWVLPFIFPVPKDCIKSSNNLSCYKISQYNALPEVVCRSFVWGILLSCCKFLCRAPLENCRKSKQNIFKQTRLVPPRQRSGTILLTAANHMSFYWRRQTSVCWQIYINK